MTPEEREAVYALPMVEALAVIASELSLVPDVEAELATRATTHCVNCWRLRCDHDADGACYNPTRPGGGRMFEVES